jgi:hypothetical protein
MGVSILARLESTLRRQAKPDGPAPGGGLAVLTLFMTPVSLRKA